MKTTTSLILTLIFCGFVQAAEPPKAASPLAAPETGAGFYADTFLSLRTPDFNEGTYGYGVGVGYQVNRYWGADVRLSHEGLDVEGSIIQDIGGRLVARMPFEALQPYTFLGGSFNLEHDIWHLQPGLGIAFGKSVQFFAEAGLDADLKGRNGYLFGAGLRIRF